MGWKYFGCSSPWEFIYKHKCFFIPFLYLSLHFGDKENKNNKWSALYLPNEGLNKKMIESKNLIF